jgi:glutamate 5-kinase
MQRLVIKVGSAVVTQNNSLALHRLSNLVELIVKLKQKGYKVILVSSGAVAAGYTLIKLDKNILSNKQVLASVGQPLLLDTYRHKFNKFNIICSQVLLEASIFDDTKRLNHAKETMDGLLNNNIIPIINENDVTAVEELVFGDNDQLAAHVTHHFNASLLVILTDIDGYYNKNPYENDDAILHKYISKIDDILLNIQPNANTQFATGGITTKLKAANFLLNKKNKMFLSSGFDLLGVKEFLLNNNHIKGTLFE